MIDFRAFVRRGLRSVGLSKIHHPSFADLLAREGIRTVFDVGANAGHYGIDLRERGYRGRLVSFEPIASVFRELEANSRRDAAWDCYRIGLGDRDQAMEISVAQASVFSSLKPPSDYTAGKFVGAAEQRRESIKVERLDTFLAAHPDLLDRPFLKIDTQGFEQEVLDGAGDMLARFHGVQLELALRPLYEGQLLWLPMIDYMAGKGFTVAMVKENGFDWDAMRLLELDVLFMRAD